VDSEVRVLFVTWDGPHSSYLRGLFLPIFAALRDYGFIFHVLQFTWAAAGERAELRAACAAAGIRYRDVQVWRRPVAAGSFLTALRGRSHVRRAVRDFGIDLLMPRSTLSAIASIDACGILPLMLDADGLPNEERVEFQGASPRGFSYRLLGILERWSVRSADAVTVRTPKAAEILAERTGVQADRFYVVRNARDEDRFRLVSRQARVARRLDLGVGDGPLVVFAGSSLSGKYMGEAMLRFFRHVRALRPDARLLLLMPCLDEARGLLCLNEDLIPACALHSVAPEDVPASLGAADLGLCLIRPTYSMQAASAIKLGEYLLCGVPVLATAGAGENEAILEPDIGFCILDAADQALVDAARWFVDSVLPNRQRIRKRCRHAGVAHFSLDIAISGWRKALLAALRNARCGCPS
jgi:hypothetical protein